jgi:hypothetical protein
VDPGSSSPVSALHSLPHSMGLEQAIQKRAEEIYIRSGRIPGHDLENWIQAEHEVLRGSAAQRTAVVIDIDGVQYVGEYNTNICQGYQPGEFQVGDDVAIRFDGDKMFVKRPNGQELETMVLRISSS